MKIAVDTSVLVGLLNPGDLWHAHAITLRDSLIKSGAELVYFDCVLAEALSTITRRLQEKKRLNEVALLIDAFNTQFPQDNITWILPDVPRLYSQVINLVRVTTGTLNFNDALISLASQERSIVQIASFDADFDQIPWLQRLVA